MGIDDMDPFDEDGEGTPLELETAPRAAESKPALDVRISEDSMAPPPVVPNAVADVPAPPVHTVPKKLSEAQLIAAFDDPPAWWSTPLYVVHVLLRQGEIRVDLARARDRRPDDVPAYLAALSAYDKAAFRRGLIGWALAFAAIFVLLPIATVILRARQH